ncbi:homeobox protein siamois-like [Xenopus laevis]|uniref:Homeobox protein siamois n=2 Tax=Xenopus laevis TaxID=8355 RepID=A0A1B4ZDM6_XENLA|nr:homeobox protein siamois-like [Xenopus laevis]OCT90588.1 hypothetical protein XELAEV_18019204mg [Xenopus laevis]BAV57543.1 siamois homeodomain 4.L [Xenopus laevis]
MTYDADLEEIIYTALTLQDDYPMLASPLRDQDMIYPNVFGMFHDLNLTMEAQEKLQEGLIELYSVLGIPQGPPINRSQWKLESEKETPSSGISTKYQANNQSSKGRKRPMYEVEQRESKKPRIQVTDHLPPANTRCRKRTIYSNEQTLFLQNQFDLNPYPDFVSRCHIAKITRIPEPRIQVWFQNRRARHLPRATSSQKPTFTEENTS